MQEFLAAQGRDVSPVSRYNVYVLKLYGAPDKGRLREMLIGLPQYEWVQEHLNLGRIALKAGNREVARGEFQRVLDRYPNYAPALSNMGTYYLYASQMDKATEFWDRARAVDPKCKQERQP